MNDNTPMAFAFDSHAVRVITAKDGDPRFVATDVCSALNMGNPRQVIARLDDDEKGVHIVDTLGGPQEVTVINESGLYSLILTSRKPEAKRFKKWITSEVLPAIRKTGHYGRGPSISQQLATQRHSLKLLAALKAKTNPEARRLIHAQLDQACRLLRLETPALEAIGYAEQPQAVPALVETFWETVEFIGLDKLNHSRDPGLIAIRLPHFEQEATAAKLRIPTLTEIHRVLRRSEAPRFMDVRTVNSRLTDGSVKCWVFAAEPPRD